MSSTKENRLNSIHDFYEAYGVENFYQNFFYANPHKEDIELCLFDALCDIGNKMPITNVLDLCSGDGLVTKYIMKNWGIETEGLDPFLSERYTKETSKDCHKRDFKDIAKNGLGKKYDCVVCSYALHLCENSLLNQVLYAIASSCHYLVLISPTKKNSEENLYMQRVYSVKHGNSYCSVFYSKILTLF